MKRKIFVFCGSFLLLISLFVVYASAAIPSVSPFGSSDLVPFGSGIFGARISTGDYYGDRTYFNVTFGLSGNYVNEDDLSSYSYQNYSLYDLGQTNSNGGLVDSRVRFYITDVSALKNDDEHYGSLSYVLRFNTVQCFLENSPGFRFINSVISPHLTTLVDDAPGVVFSLNKVDGISLFRDDVQVKADFYMPGINQSFTSSYFGKCVSYYDILVYSNIDWSDYAEEYESFCTPQEFENYIEQLKGSDSNLMYLSDDADLMLLSFLFDWVGPIYGDVDVKYVGKINDVPSVPNNNADITFDVTETLVSKSLFEDFYLESNERSAYRGLTGYERVTKWLGSAVSGFLSVEIIPNFSLAALLLIIISFSIVVWWLKVFAGG